MGSESPPGNSRDPKAFTREDTSESVEEGTESLDEKYDLYHKTFSGAMQHSYEYAKKKFKIEIDPTEIDDKVAMGPPKPKNGKTNSYRLKGKNGKGIQVQVYNTGTSFFSLSLFYGNRLSASRSGCECLPEHV